MAATMGVVGPRESSYRPDEKAVPDESDIPLPEEPNIKPPVSLIVSCCCAVLCCAVCLPLLSSHCCLSPSQGNKRALKSH